MHEFRCCVAPYGADYRLRSFSCWDQFLCMAFAQLTFRESLRDIEACLRAAPARLYHLGIRSRVSRTTLAEANEKRDWHVYADFARALIRIARPLYAAESFGVDLDHTVYALDSTTARSKFLIIWIVIHPQHAARRSAQFSGSSVLESPFRRIMRWSLDTSIYWVSPQYMVKSYKERSHG